MPQSITIAAFVFGSVLLLIAILGGKFKIFGAEVSDAIGPYSRIASGALGVIFIIIGLFGEFVSKNDLQQQYDTKQQQYDSKKSTAIPITITYELGQMVQGIATVYINNENVGILTVNRNKQRAAISVTLPKPGTYEYSIQAKMTIMGYVDPTIQLEAPIEYESNGRGTIEVEANKEFILRTNDIVLGGAGNNSWTSVLEDRAIQ